MVGSAAESAPVAVVTGGARGVGAATGRLLHARGYRVALVDRDGDAVEAVAADLGEGAISSGVDVTDRAAFTRLLDEVEGRWGRIDVLVNNAGIMPLNRIEDESCGLTTTILEVNLVAVLEATKEIVRRWQAAGVAGHVVNVSSAAGRVPLAGAATYTATKHAVSGFSNALHLEFLATGSPIRVTALHPGTVRTDLAVGFGPSRSKLLSVSAERVAAGVLSAVSRPRPNVYVPGYLGPAIAMQGLVPHRIGAWLSSRLGGEAALQAMAAPERAAYDRRLSAMVCGPESGAEPSGA